jgi:hypothetical protein
MRITGEKKLGIILLMVGMVIIVGTQIMINKHGGLVIVNITPVEDEPWPKWKPLEYTQLDCPSSLIYQQEVGIVVSTVGATLLIRPFVFESKQMKYNKEKD